MNGPIPLGYFTPWLAAGERGLSSEAIVSHLTGHQVGSPFAGRSNRRDHPWDPDDFRRCQLLLKACPLAALAFDQMRTASPQWARLVDAWDEIHATIESECPDYLARPRGEAPKGYRLMKQVLAGPTEGSGQ